MGKEELQRFAGRKVLIQRRLQQPEAQWQLRMKFLKQAKSYIGVPYAKKYHQPGTPESKSLLFLDCCGLIRRAVRDLTEDFGFYIGSGNQAYQYDTLPITLPSEEHLKPGDLVFISGTYFDTQRARQPHDIVHVEIWLGEEKRSLGARWKGGKVQVFDSFKFVSKTYGSMEYHFKSIETWLQGICIRKAFTILATVPKQQLLGDQPLLIAQRTFSEPARGKLPSDPGCSELWGQAACMRDACRASAKQKSSSKAPSQPACKTGMRGSL
ncbi:uncharacterized protein LOC129344861 [Eublepharis macularius]|uniref:Uncharacterized protein LOC129344861 n=1 Tax=Eublepharis macularius TaxID=481883 RepID=A0AA97KKK9_EUBMA|nr:uncharacterized protein LOC129344861 [Eublepharis macularius]